MCLSYYRYNNLPFRLSKFLQISKEEREQTLANLESKNALAVGLVAFCLMPNHIHLLVKQIVDEGISKYMRQISDSFTRYFNTKYQRVGPLFQGTFKAVRIENDEQLIHVSRYIHLNPLTSFVVREGNFINYPWSSLKDYLGGDSKIINSQIVLNNFQVQGDYLKFVMDQADYGKELERIKHLILEK